MNMQQAGWYPDPWAQAAQRWWDGTQWTAHVTGPPARQPPAQQPTMPDASPASGSTWAVPGSSVEPAARPPANPPTAGAMPLGPWAAPPSGHLAPWGVLAPAPRPVSVARSNPLAAIVLAAGALAVVVGSFLPWAVIESSFGDISIGGGDMDGDASLTVAGVVAIAVLGGLAVFGRWARGAVTGLAISALVVTGVVALIALVDIADVATSADDMPGLDVSVGVGLWVVLAGSLVAAAGAVMVLVTAVRRPAPALPFVPAGPPPAWRG